MDKFYENWLYENILSIYKIKCGRNYILTILFYSLGIDCTTYIKTKDYKRMIFYVRLLKNLINE